MTATRVVTANVASSLDRAAAARCLDMSLALRPDIVGLQEWRAHRALLLRRRGSVRFTGTPLEAARDRRSAPTRATSEFHWVAAALGDCVVGLRADRFRIIHHEQRRLGGFALADRQSGRKLIEPPRWATVVDALDLVGFRLVGVIVFHLAPGSQRRGSYREDRPRTTARHRLETSRVQSLVDELDRRCDVVWALGDSNFHDFALRGLTSAWEGRGGHGGTLGSYRRIDDVFSTIPPGRLQMSSTESDHQLVMVDYGSR
jgi:hypothetical protein